MAGLEEVIGRYRDRAGSWDREAKVEEERSAMPGDRHVQAARHGREEGADWHALADLLYAIEYPDNALGSAHLATAAERLARRLDPQWGGGGRG